MKAQIRLADLPKGWTKDHAAERIGDEIVVPGSLPGKAWFVKASDRCAYCHGSGMVKRIEHDVAVKKDESGKEKEERISYEDEGPCDCVFYLCNKEEARRATRGVPSGPAPAPREDPKPNGDYLRKRADRLRAEIAVQEAALETLRVAHEARLAPLLARVTDLEQQIEGLVNAEAKAREFTAAAEIQAALSQEMPYEARRNAEEAERLVLEAQENLRSRQEALAPLALMLDAAKGAVRVATNRGGDRHKSEVLRGRLADLRGRLEEVERDLPKVVAETAPAEAVEATP